MRTPLSIIAPVAVLAASAASAQDTAILALVDRFEEATIRATLETVQGDVRSALAALGIPRKTFYDKLKRHEIDVEAYRPTKSQPSS